MTDALFDLALNRAARFVRAAPHTPLHEWHARTRFAARVPLLEIETRLRTQPRHGVWVWIGGPHGAWVQQHKPYSGSIT